VKPKKCKKCAGIFTPKIQAQPKCPDCAFWHHKQKLCDYQNKTLINRTKKPQKPLKAKIDVEQARINKIVRERDADKPCISCGKKMEEWELNAGHFHSRNQCPKLRYDLDNIHGQCSSCNSKMTEDPKIPANYRKNLLERIGAERVARIDLERKNAGRILPVE
jgi:5-methylcytosine-specific restriction endonuclease McrA